MEELAQAFLQRELRVKIKKDKDNAAKPPGEQNPSNASVQSAASNTMRK